MTTTSKPEVRYEDSAEMRTGISGWVCAHCQRFWGNDEHMARYCCATSMPCECGGRREKHYSYCEACRKKRADAKWEALEKVEWDGETPLCEWDNDRYFFDEDALAEHVEDHIAEGGAIEDIRLVLCRPTEVRTFEMADFLSDSLAEDFDPGKDFDEIDKVVNDWIAARIPFSWEPGGKGISLDSIRSLVRPEG